ncbi:MAG: hypothetical protein AB1611_20115 [bacterium]
MEDTVNGLSLRPYLEIRKAPFSLQLSLISEDPLVLEKAPFPFRVISDEAPFTRLVDARLVTDAGSEIRRVFLLVQKDSYPLTADALRSLNNRGIDDAWQRAFAGAGRGENNSSSVILLNQIDNQEGKKRLVPFQPLFFCKKQKLFFDPPCPECGLPLRQCQDDDLLIRSGLQPYSTSLRRHLYCPACAASPEGAEFYTLALESMDPPGLLDRRDLIRNFGRLLEGRGNAGPLPCGDCAEKQECYGRSNRCLSRIASFAFYPFFMVIFEAMSLQAPDFLALVSGASFEELEAGLAASRESGRADCLKAIRRKHPGGVFTFFNQGENSFGERYFAEVLYLKLSFLGEFLQAAFSGLALDHDQQHDPGFSLDRTWVRLARQSGLLPLFWSFSLRTPDLKILPCQASLNSRIPPVSSLYSLGLVWFHTLLVNQKQDIGRVYQALEERMSMAGSDNEAPGPGHVPDPTQRSQAFSPENIFWQPDRGAVSESGRRCWEKCLDLGWSLIRAGYHAPSQWSPEEFRRQFEALREEVKKMLFQGDQDQGRPDHEGRHREALPEQHPPEGCLPESTPEESRSDPQEDKAIHDILVSIVNAWRAETDVKQEISAELTQTIVLSSAHRETVEPASTIEETVMLSSDQVREDHISKASEDPTLETVIISPVAQGAPAAPAGFEEPEPAQETCKPESAPDDFLAETLILSPRPSAASQKVRDRTKKKGP